MATTVDYILKVSAQQGVKSLGDVAKKAFEANKGLVKLAGTAAIGFVAIKQLASTIFALGEAMIDTAKAAVEMAQESADLINDINDLSNRSAIAADTIKGLQFALQASGQSAGQATQLLSRFPAVLAQAEVETSRTALGFKKLGVEVRNVDGTLRPANDVFLETLTRLQDIDDQTTRAKMAFDIFGRSAGQLLQALGQAEGLRQFVEFTEKFGVRTGPKASDAAADFQVVAAGLDTVLKGLKSTFIETFGPNITQLIIKFGSQLAFVQSVIVSLSDTITLVFTAAMNTLVRIFQGIVDLVPAMIASFVASFPVFGKLGALLFKITKPLFELTGLESRFQSTFNSFSKAISQATVDAALFEEQLSGLVAGEFAGFATGGAGAGVISAETTGGNGGLSRFADGIDALTVEFDNVGSEIIESIGELSASLTGLPALIEKSFRVSVAGTITNAIVAGVSGPSGFIGVLGSAFDNLTMGLSGTIASAIGGIARLGEKSPKEIQQDFQNFAKAFEKGLKMLPRVLIQVLPRFVVALIKGFAQAIFELPFILKSALDETFRNIWSSIKEFFRSIFTKEGRQERREERGEPSAAARFFNLLLTGQEAFMAGGIMSAQSGARFTRGKRGFAMLHEGETVLPASGRAGQAEQRMMRQSSGGGGINIVINSAVVENRAIDELVRKLETRFGQFGVGKSSLFGR